MSVERFLHLLTALDAAEADETPATRADLTKAWKALTKLPADKATFEALAPLVRANVMPSTQRVLQRALERDDALHEIADEALRQQPREVWRVEQDLPRKMCGIGARFHGPEPLLAIPVGKKLTLFDPRDLSVVEEAKLPAEAKAMAFIGRTRLRAVLDDGRVVERALGQAKWKDLHELGEISDASIDGDLVVAIAPDPSGGCPGLVLLDLATGTLARHALPANDIYHPQVLGPLVRVDASVTNGGTVFIGRGTALPVEVVLPAGELPVELAVVGGVAWLLTLQRGFGSLWRKLDDLSEDTRFGRDFHEIDVCGDAVWSGAGDRFVGGVRTSPLAWDSSIEVMAVSPTIVVALGYDAKSKPRMRRYARYTPPSASS